MRTSAGPRAMHTRHGIDPALLSCAAGTAILSGAGCLLAARGADVVLRLQWGAATLVLLAAWILACQWRFGIELVTRRHAEDPSERRARALAEQFEGLLRDFEEEQREAEGRRSDLDGVVRSRAAMLAHDNRKLHKLDRLKDEFVSLLAHELRTPLTSVRSYVELLLSYGDGIESTERKEFLEIVRGQVQRLTRLINELLDLSRLRSGKLQLHAQNCPLAPCLQEVLESAAVLAHANPHDIASDGFDRTLEAFADSDRVVQILLNLVSNAIKYSPSGCRIEIAGGVHDADRVQLTVTDDGPGIPAEERELVFEPFYRTRQVGQSNIEGTGLGLFLSREFARQMGGELRAEAAPDHGARFVLTLPRRGVAAVAQVDVAPALAEVREEFDDSIAT